MHFGLQQTLQSGFDFLVAPLAHPRYRRPSPKSLPKGGIQAPFTRSDLLLTSSQWGSQVSTDNCLQPANNAHK